MAIEVGEKVTGKVSGITNFGAFIDLGNHQTGLVHISEISDSYVKDIHDILKVGDEVTVKVLKIDENHKIGLSIRKAVDKPQSREHSDRDRNHSQHHDHHEHSSYGQHNSRGGHSNSSHAPKKKAMSFDDMMSGFLKESEDRLATLKHNTEGKRGGRGGRRS